MLRMAPPHHQAATDGRGGPTGLTVGVVHPTKPRPVAAPGCLPEPQNVPCKVALGRRGDIAIDALRHVIQQQPDILASVDAAKPLVAAAHG